MAEISQIAFIWTVLLGVDGMLMLIYFSGIGAKQWANVISSAGAYFVSTGLATMITSGAMTLGGVGDAGASIDSWAAGMLSWHSYLMMALCGYSILQNTVLSRSRQPSERPGDFKVDSYRRR